jgi:hypothetical protein
LYNIIFIPILCLFLLIVFHIILNYLLENLAYTFLLSFLLNTFILLIITTILGISNHNTITDIIFLLSGNFIIFLCTSYVYINILYVGNASIRFRILHLIYMSADGITKDELIKEYNAESILYTRLNRLQESKQIIKQDDRYYSGIPKQIIMAIFFQFWRRIILGETPENQ